MHIHVDIIGPLPSSWGYSYALTMLDHTMQQTGASPTLSRITTEHCAHAFCHGWVEHFRVPLILLPTVGAESSPCGLTWLSPWGPLSTSVYHLSPPTQWTHWVLHSPKTVLHAHPAGPDWYDHLPWTLLAVRHTPKEDLSASPAVLTYRHLLLLPGALMSPQPPQDIILPFALSHHAPAQLMVSDVPVVFMTAQFIFLSVDGSHSCLSSPYCGLFHVLQLSTKTSIISEDSCAETASVGCFHGPSYPSDFCWPPQTTTHSVHAVHLHLWCCIPVAASAFLWYCALLPQIIFPL